MYKYKHNKTGEVIETTNKVASKNWTEIEAKQPKAGTGAAATGAPATGKSAETKKGSGKKGEGKKTGEKQEPGKEAGNQ